jgi:hypothetical protein
MPLRGLYRCLLCGGALFVSAAGCISFHSYRPAPVLVRDAETKQPIAGAAVRLWYPLGSGHMPPAESSGVSDGEGIAHLQAAPYGDGGIELEAKAKGFMPAEHNISTETIAGIEPEHWYKKTGPRPASIVVEMYAEPRPEVQLIVPNDYRGVVRVKLLAQEDIPWPPRQRVFPFPIDGNGNAEARLPAAIRQFYPPEIGATYADGRVLSRDANPQEIGLHVLRFSAGEYVFVVGTKSEFDAIRSLTHVSSGDDRPSRGGGGGGRGGGGRGHRHGGQGQNPPPDQ